MSTTTVIDDDSAITNLQVMRSPIVGAAAAA
jgi:hypothetical protein